jgi:predicted kinase
VSRRARLIHLNGPCGIGKSTLAQLYTDRHPGVLNLDIDQLVYLIGGWRERLRECLRPARDLALAMAATHLRAGHDVVLPQLMVRASEIERFEAVALDNNAEFREIVLIAGKEHSLDRVAQRIAGRDQDRDRQLDRLVEHNGGQELRARLYDQLADLIRDSPPTSVIHTDNHNPAQTYQALTEALAERACG